VWASLTQLHALPCPRRLPVHARERPSSPLYLYANTLFPDASTPFSKTTTTFSNANTPFSDANTPFYNANRPIDYRIVPGSFPNSVVSVGVCYTAVDAAAGGSTTGWWAVVLECVSSHPLTPLLAPGNYLRTLETAHPPPYISTQSRRSAASLKVPCSY